jgi:hypothetical protein
MAGWLADNWFQISLLAEISLIILLLLLIWDLLATLPANTSGASSYDITSAAQSACNAVASACRDVEKQIDLTENISHDLNAISTKLTELNDILCKTYQAIDYGNDQQRRNADNLYQQIEALQQEVKTQTYTLVEIDRQMPQMPRTAPSRTHPKRQTP